MLSFLNGLIHAGDSTLNKDPIKNSTKSNAKQTLDNVKFSKNTATADVNASNSSLIVDNGPSERSKLVDDFLVKDKGLNVDKEID